MFYSKSWAQIVNIFFTVNKILTTVWYTWIFILRNTKGEILVQIGNGMKQDIYLGFKICYHLSCVIFNQCTKGKDVRIFISQESMQCFLYWKLLMSNF